MNHLRPFKELGENLLWWSIASTYSFGVPIHLGLWGLILIAAVRIGFVFHLSIILLIRVRSVGVVRIVIVIIVLSFSPDSGRTIDLWRCSLFLAVGGIGVALIITIVFGSGRL